MAQQIPLVDYLVLGDDPHLVANECTACGARFFDRRNACASCERDRVHEGATCPTTGEVRAFTIVAFAAPGIPVPFVAAVVDCEGTSVRANLINVTPDPEHVTLGMKVRLATEVDRHGRQRHRSDRLRLRTTGRLSSMASASEELWILGIHMTKFGKHPDKDTVDLAAEAVRGALADGGVTMKDMGIIGAGNLMAARCRHRAVAPEADRPDRHPRLQRGQRLRHRGHRAAGRLHGDQGRRDRHGPGLRRREAGRRRPARRRQPQERSATPGRPRAATGRWPPIDGRIGTETMPGVFAQIGMEYGHRYGGTSFELFAKISEKNHAHSTLNPLAAYTKKMTLEEIMGDVMIAYPNTRPMCSANCDGAAAAVVVSGSKLKTLSLGAAAAGGEDLGVDPHHRPVGGGVPDPART